MPSSCLWNILSPLSASWALSLKKWHTKSSMHKHACRSTQVCPLSLQPFKTYYIAVPWSRLSGTTSHLEESNDDTYFIGVRLGFAYQRNYSYLTMNEEPEAYFYAETQTNRLTLPLGFHILSLNGIHMENQQATTASIRRPYVLKDISPST